VVVVRVKGRKHSYLGVSVRLEGCFGLGFGAERERRKEGEC